MIYEITRCLHIIDVGMFTFVHIFICIFNELNFSKIIKQSLRKNMAVAEKMEKSVRKFVSRLSMTDLGKERIHLVNRCKASAAWCWRLLKWGPPNAGHGAGPRRGGGQESVLGRLNARLLSNIRAEMSGRYFGSI